MEEGTGETPLTKDCSGTARVGGPRVWDTSGLRVCLNLDWTHWSSYTDSSVAPTHVPTESPGPEPSVMSTKAEPEDLQRDLLWSTVPPFCEFTGTPLRIHLSLTPEGGCRSRLSVRYLTGGHGQLGSLLRLGRLSEDVQRSVSEGRFDEDLRTLCFCHSLLCTSNKVH